MKELMIKSKKEEGFELFILGGEFSYFSDTELEESDMNTDNPEYAYELFKMLNKANELGAFDKVKPDPDNSDEDIETIYV